MATQNEHTHSLDYNRRLYENIMDWYKNADTKAQLILTLDGIFLTVVANTFLKNAETIGKLPWYSQTCFGLMSVTLVLSLFSAIYCIWSRLLTKGRLEKIMNEAGIVKYRHDTYKASVCWFFQFVAFLDESEFQTQMHTVEPGFEIDALSSQIYILAGNVTKKHKAVDFGFVFAGITLFLFLASGISLIFPL